MKTGILWDERYLLHDTGPFHPERPERLRAIKEILDHHTSYASLKPRRATPEEVSLVHSRAHVEEVARLAGTAGHYFDGDTPAGPKSSEAAFLAAGGLIEAVESIEEGLVKNAFVFPRPPGHHAEADRAMGFCLFNNVAIAAQYLVERKRKKRVLIMDFDVHHGNGTQHFFYDRPDVFYVSTHRFPFYPGTGAEEEKGSGPGLHYNLNVPLMAGAGDEEYQRAFQDIVVPAIDDYKPDFILVSAGYDAHARDPLGGMGVSQAGFKMMSASLVTLAKKHCQGKIAFALEGGYDLKGLQEGVAATLETL